MFDKSRTKGCKVLHEHLHPVHQKIQVAPKSSRGGNQEGKIYFFTTYENIGHPLLRKLEILLRIYSWLFVAFFCPAFPISVDLFQDGTEIFLPSS